MAVNDLTYEDFVAGQRAKTRAGQTYQGLPVQGAPVYGTSQEDFLKARKDLGLNNPTGSALQVPDISAGAGQFGEVIDLLKTAINAPKVKTDFAAQAPADSGFQGILDTVSAQLAGLSNDRTDFSGALAKAHGDTTFADTLQALTSQLSGFTTNRAFSDAAGLMEQRSQVEREKNAPVIQKAMEGAGTSAGSMQALLAQRDASNTATAASALGAEQARTYAGATTNILGSLAALVASGDPQAKILTQILGLKSQERGQEAATGANLAGVLAQLTAAGDPNNKLLVQLQGLQQQEDASQLQAQTQLIAQLSQLAASGDPQIKNLLDIFKTQTVSADNRAQIAASERNTDRSVAGGIEQSNIAANTALSNAATQAASAKYQIDATQGVNFATAMREQLALANSANKEDNPWI